MRKLWMVLVLAGLLLGGLGWWTFDSVQGKEPAERHPHIRHALHKLREARKELRMSAHDFGGHRVAAIKDVDRAIHQLEKALKYDKK
jgi:hypothetical protein